MFANLFKNKIENKIAELDYENFQPNQAFVKNLEQRFVNKALTGADQKRSAANTGFTFLFKSSGYLRLQSVVAILLLASLLFVGGFGFVRVRNNQIAASTLNQIYSQNPQTALLPVLVAMQNKLDWGQEQALNLALVSLKNKEFYGSETTLEFEFSDVYKNYYQKCENALPINPDTAKIIAYELYSSNGYTFKTHTFNSANQETDLLIFNGGTYHSVKQNKVFVENVQPKDLSTQSIFVQSINTDNISWQENLSCAEEALTLSTTLTYQNDLQVLAYAVSINNNDFYKISVSTKSLTEAELIKLDEIFNSKSVLR